MLKISGAVRTGFTFPAIGMLIFLLVGESTIGTAGADSGKSYILDYVGNYNAALYPRKELKAVLTTDAIAVDGIMDKGL